MEYQALYRKYRPQRFSEVVGQGHVTETLGREVIEGKVAHAYLFSGPRGTGKTTSARILAKSLNCVDRAADGEPCNQCDSCQAITAGTSMDVVELDAASHNKVEDVRDIRVSVSTVASVGGAKRVFILDEAHMLTKAAGNALLKTLEEPPDHVHFVLATTEPYKLLDTIRSRSQRFDFQPVSIETLADHLQHIADLEGYEVADGSLLSVARHAGGSVRDSLSLLEQVAALGAGTIDDAGVRRALGLAGRDAYVRIAEAMAASDAQAGLVLVSELASSGIDLRQFVGDAVAFFRGVFLAQYGEDIESVVDEPADVVADWRTVAAKLAPADVLRAVDLLSEALIKLREGREERLMLELAMLKLTRPEVSDDPASLSARIARLEGGARPAPAAQPAEVRPAAAPVATPVQSEPAVEPAAPEPIAQPTESGQNLSPEPQVEEPEPVAETPGDVEPPAAPESPTRPSAVPTTGDLHRVWPQLVASVRELGARRDALFREASPDGVEGSTVVLTLPAHLEFHLEQLRNDAELVSFVADRASALLGNLVTVQFRIMGATTPAAQPEPAAADDDPIPDKDRMLEAPAGATDPLSLLQSELGAEIVADPDAET